MTRVSVKHVRYLQMHLGIRHHLTLLCMHKKVSLSIPSIWWQRHDAKYVAMGDTGWEYVTVRIADTKVISEVCDARETKGCEGKGWLSRDDVVVDRMEVARFERWGFTIEFVQPTETICRVDYIALMRHTPHCQTTLMTTNVIFCDNCFQIINADNHWYSNIIEASKSRLK